jgi:hypothetical protein
MMHHTGLPFVQTVPISREMLAGLLGILSKISCVRVLSAMMMRSRSSMFGNSSIQSTHLALPCLLSPMTRMSRNITVAGLPNER